MKTVLHFSVHAGREKRPTKLLVLVLSLLFTASGIVRAQPVPHHFDSIAALPDRTIKLRLEGSVSDMVPNLPVGISNQFKQMFDLYLVEASANLNDWTRMAMPLRTNNNPSPLVVVDTNAPGLSQRFYRTCTNHLLTAFLKPSGPFAVGTVDRVMVDPARTNLYRYTPKTNAFMVTFWYPADAPPAGAMPAAMQDKRLASDPALYISGGYDPRWASIMPKLVGHRFQGIPLAGGNYKYPVVLASHGLPAWRKVGSRNAEELASYGYVVVAIDHPDCWATEFPDGRYLAGNHSGDVPGRLQDMTFLLDKLAELNTVDPLFMGRLDLDHIGVEGGSYGGMVVKTCASDDRVKCALFYDAMNIQSLCPAGLQKPFLVGLGESNYFYSEDLWLFSKAVTNAVFLQLRGAGHNTPCDVGWTTELPGGRGPALAMDACRVWFFDTYLKGQTPPFPTNPEIYNVNRK